MKKKLKLTKSQLEDLYLGKKMSSQNIADKLKKISARTIRKKLKKFGIKTRSISEALTRKFKKSFINNLSEKAYFLGLRAGDFHARWARKSIRVQTTTTHLAQINLLKSAFENYGEIRTYLTKNKSRENEWFIYVDLDKSFKFLLSKPKEIPYWVLRTKKYFFQFLAAYMDCEGSWKVQKSHQRHTRFIFKIRTGDLKILKQIKRQLEIFGYHPCLYLDRKRGDKTNYGTYNQNMFDLTINRREEVISLTKDLLLMSKHNEKIRKMNFILKNKNTKWADLQEIWV